MVETGILLDSIRLVVGILILGYASYTDIKTRRAANLLWVIMGSIGAILLIAEYFLIGFDLLITLAIIAFIVVFAYVLFQVRLIFGGADAKALMALALLVPLQPEINQLPLWKTLMPFPWSIFSNAIVIFLIIPLMLLIYNIAKRNLEFPYSLLGYKMTIEKAKTTFVWPLEKIRDGKRKFMYMPKDFDVEEELHAFEQQGINEIWVTPKVPFMIPLLAGFICAFTIGDILFHIMSGIL
jgi:preflagellin peptidase FlaK